MVSDAESMGGPMARGRRGTFGSARDGWLRQTMGISVDTIPMVRSSTFSFGTGTPQVVRDFYLHEPCTVKEFVLVTPTSLTWKDRAGGFDIKLTQGAATSHAQYNWTIPIGAWTQEGPSLSGYFTRTGCGRSVWGKQVIAPLNGRYYVPCNKYTE